MFSTFYTQSIFNADNANVIAKIPTIYGINLAKAGDVNGDSINDIIIRDSDSNKVYVIYGKRNITSPITDSINITSNKGFIINVAYPIRIYNVVNAGDVNGDGIDDIIVGTGGNSVYVIYGGKNIISPITASNITSNNGFIINIYSNTDEAISNIGDVNGDSINDIIVNAGGNSVYVIYGGRNITSPITASNITSNNGFIINRPSDFNSDIVSASDVNGDSINDIIIGDRSNDRAYVIYGGRNITSSITASNITSSNGFIINGNRGQLGYSIASAGDVNGDGLSDVIIGTPGRYSNGYVCSVYVVYGSSNIISPIAASNITSNNGFIINSPGSSFGSLVASAGDVNGDSINDIIVGTGGNSVYVIYGGKNIISPITASNITSSNGFIINGLHNSYLDSIASAGDINSDGVDDIIIGDTGNDRSYVIYGGKNIISPITASSITSNSGFIINGASVRSVASVEDVNDDGKTDIIFSTQNVVYVIYSEPILIRVSAKDVPSLVSSTGFIIEGAYSTPEVASVEDVNGDHIDDIIIGDAGNDRAYVIYGGRNVYSLTSLTSSNGFIINGPYKSNLGRSVASAGDVNNDGITDIIVGAAYTNSEAGAAYVVYGGRNLGSITASSITSNNGFIINGPYNSYLGISVSSAGDVNGDGIDDIIVGTGGHSAYVIYGGRNITSPITASNITSSNGFIINGAGTSVAGIGDINGDHIDDISVGAGVLNAPGYVIYGGKNIISPITASTITSSNGFIINGPDHFYADVSVASAGDTNGDGRRDILIRYGGTAYVIYGDYNLVSPLTVSSIPSSRGFIINDVSSLAKRAGDVNGDGIDDIIVATFEANIGVIYGDHNLISPLTASSIPSNRGFIINGAGGDVIYSKSVACIGDINGDSKTDIIVSGATGTMSGVIYVIYGNSTVEARTPLSSAAPTSIPTTAPVLMPSSNNNPVPAPFATSIPTISNIDILTLTSNQGFAIKGVKESYFGVSVSSAGDINGDGKADIIIGATQPNGTAYVIFGVSAANKITSSINISSMNNSQGFIINGSKDSGFGTSISNIGDINGDGRSDIIIGAPTNGGETGAAYVIYGRNNIISPITASSITSSQGCIINGDEDSSLGRSVAGIGDINGDGKSDIIIGAYNQDGNEAGTAYVIYGGNSIPSPIRASSITSSQGFRIEGPAKGSNFGLSVASAGDVNGDGKSDIMVSAPQVNTSAGAVYVIYGGSIASTIKVSAMSSSQGFIINGPAGSNLGISVASAGDVNGDGRSDIIIGAPSANNEAGAVYVIYGSNNITSPIAASSLTGSQGFVIRGLAGSNLGSAVARAGDINGDGKSDIIIGAPSVNNEAGAVYVIYGNNNIASFTVSAITSTRGFVISGDKNSYLGSSVANVGDINGDGKSDVIVGATGADIAYVIYGLGNAENPSQPQVLSPDILAGLQKAGDMPEMSYGLLGITIFAVLIDVADIF